MLCQFRTFISSLLFKFEYYLLSIGKAFALSTSLFIPKGSGALKH